MKKFLLGILVGLLLAVATVLMLSLALVTMGGRRPVVRDGSVLLLKLEGELPERPPFHIPLPFFEERAQPAMYEIWGLLERASADRRIQAVVLMAEQLEAGWGKLEEIRSDLEAFRKSGKPVYALLRSPGAREYYLATAADRVYMAPEDFLDLKGLRAEAVYVRGTLDKLGVQVEVEAAGKYKDFGDMFTRSSMSPETREVLNSILDDLYGQLIERLAKARRRSAEQVRATLDEGPFLGRQALARGLVDALMYEDQMFDELKGRLKRAAIHRLSHRDYLRAQAGEVGGARVALVAAEGAILPDNMDDPLSGEEAIRPTEFRRVLEQVREDSGIRGVVLRIDSPGGSGIASDEILRDMRRLAQKKPLVVSMSDVAASGGYYIALTGSPMLAYPGTFTGSIGVVYGKANLHGLYEKLGAKKEILARGRFADIDSDYVSLSEAGRKKLRQAVDEFYRDFVRRVADARRRDFDEVEPLAQGRVWLGSQAKQNGLIDELGGLDRAIELVKQKAGIRPEERVRLVIYPPRRSLLDYVIERGAALGAFARPGVLSGVQEVWLRGGLLRLMPYQVVVR